MVMGEFSYTACVSLSDAVSVTVRQSLAHSQHSLKLKNSIL